MSARWAAGVSPATPGSQALLGALARPGNAAMLPGYVGEDATCDRVFSQFANAYADLTELDHRAHLDAIDDGLVQAEHSV